MNFRGHDTSLSWLSERINFLDKHPVFRGDHGHHQPSPSGSGVQFRSIDGTQNNLAEPTLNAAGTSFTRLGDASFDDGFLTPRNGPNPREISNVVVDGQGDIPDPSGLSGFMYVWGQFIDHDLDLSRSDGVNHIDIAVPADDSFLAPGSTIPLTRAIISPSSGVPGSPAIAVNSITGWLDASMVYGSDAATAASLRTADGHMKISEGDNLPIVDGRFVAGDIRVAENPDLIAIQTLFVREHNYQVDRLHALHPNWPGDQLYENAKAIVTAEIANITYKEFLPHLLGPDAIPAYQGYDPTVDPRITQEFAGAAYRFGHSIVSAELGQIDEFGVETATQALKDAFGQTPDEFIAAGTADALLRALAADAHNKLDPHIVDDLRNFLMDPAGTDLAAVNIERGRDLGLGTLNETRVALGLDPYDSFEQLTSDSPIASKLAAVYDNVDQVDLWVGGLAEDRAAGALVGETFQIIIAQQFTALRDGDHFWFENQGFDPKTLKMIKTTTLSDIIVRNTDVNHMQADAFVATERTAVRQAQRRM